MKTKAVCLSFYFCNIMDSSCQAYVLISGLLHGNDVGFSYKLFVVLLSVL